jgi:hypothetical protein
MSYQCAVNGSCQTPAQGQRVYDNSACDHACPRFYHCDAEANCVQERAHLRHDVLYYPNDPTCDNACDAPGPRWVGYNRYAGYGGDYFAPFPRYHNHGGWRGGHGHH